MITWLYCYWVCGKAENYSRDGMAEQICTPHGGGGGGGVGMDSRVKIELSKT